MRRGISGLRIVWALALAGACSGDSSNGETAGEGGAPAGGGQGGAPDGDDGPDAGGGGGGGATGGEGEGEPGGEGEGGPGTGEGEGEPGGEGEGEGEACAPVAVRNVPHERPVRHHDEGTPIEYASRPPAAGDHYGDWTEWGESLEELDARAWVHNLEHGGIAFLYRCPEGCDDIVAAVRAFAAARPADDGGAFRHLITPYGDMDHPLAVVAWEWIYEADCWSEEGVAAFVTEHYRKAPEDEAGPPPGGH